MSARVVMEVPCCGETHRVAVRECEEDPGIEFVVLDHDPAMLAAFTTFGAATPDCVAYAELLDEALDAFITAHALAWGRRGWNSLDAGIAAVAAGDTAFEFLKIGDPVEAQKQASIAAALEARYGKMMLWQVFNDMLIGAEHVRREALRDDT
jgi:hypothetical protein